MSIEPATHQPNAPDKHDHGKSDNIELIFSLTCGVLLVVGWLGPKLGIVPGWLSILLLVGAYVFGGFFALKEAIEKVADAKFEIDFLMLVAAAGAAILGAWAEGALLLFCSAWDTRWSTMRWAVPRGPSRRWQTSPLTPRSFDAMARRSRYASKTFSLATSLSCGPTSGCRWTGS